MARRGMSSQNTKSPIEDSPDLKRSKTVTLVLLASAGAVAWGLAKLDPSQKMEDVRVYPNAEGCIAGHVRTEDDCRHDYATIRLAYPNVAPRYDVRSVCEAHHGVGNCVSGETVSSDASGRFVPILAGYVVGVTVRQSLVPQPIFPHREREAGSGSTAFVHTVSYCTSWGGRLTPAVGGMSSAVRACSAAVRPPVFGGFGATGRDLNAECESAAGSGG